MSTPRTVTVPTIDHGPLTLDCPDWCVGHDRRPQYRTDVTHYSPEHLLTHDGQPLLVVVLAQAPFTETGSREVGAYVEQTGASGTYSPVGLDALAATLVEHARELRSIARRLAVLREVGR
ncbi:DUF6907 domain-containing protein [Streptomyces wuyuanensis]|uniref:DUF6907 domain-containing protein n=1 Tax=Streptomyces wuyuanensis TaxID=1196353 RepID=UPI003718836C